jgi:hypothetical protein
MTLSRTSPVERSSSAAVRSAPLAAPYAGFGTSAVCRAAGCAWSKRAWRWSRVVCEHRSACSAVMASHSRGVHHAARALHCHVGHEGCGRPTRAHASPSPTFSVSSKGAGHVVRTDGASRALATRPRTSRTALLPRRPGRTSKSAASHTVSLIVRRSILMMSGNSLTRRLRNAGERENFNRVSAEDRSSARPAGSRHYRPGKYLAGTRK